MRHFLASLWTLAIVALTSYPIIELTGFKASLYQTAFWNLDSIPMWIAYTIALLIFYMLALGKLRNPLWALAIIVLTIYPVIELSRYISAFYGIFMFGALLGELTVIWFYYIMGVLVVLLLLIRQRRSYEMG